MPSTPRESWESYTRATKAQSVPVVPTRIARGIVQRLAEPKVSNIVSHFNYYNIT